MFIVLIDVLIEFGIWFFGGSVFFKWKVIKRISKNLMIVNMWKIVCYVVNGNSKIVLFVIGVIIGVIVVMIINSEKNLESFFLVNILWMIVWDSISFVEVVNFCKKCVVINVVILGDSV